MSDLCDTVELSNQRKESLVNNLELGQVVRITYLQPYNGAGASRWKVGEIVKVTPKWVQLSGHRGGWLPRDGILTIEKW